MERLSPDQIQIRDPFVLPVPEENRYYLYGTTDKWCWDGPGGGFDYYTSPNLKEWQGPFPAFRPPAGFWAETNFWAPEVHRYQNRFFMLASFKRAEVCRGTQVLVANEPSGPFVPYSDGPITPCNWECLDGTLFLEQGEPWLVYCHEWVQIRDGAIYAQRLTSDLRRTMGKPHLLFSATQAPWVHKGPVGDGFVTDGPFLFRCQSGELLLLWSSFARDGYALSCARSQSGTLLGPWEQEAEPLYQQDGGHGMLFRGLDGQLYLTLHTPNDTPNERPVFWPVTESEGRLQLQEMSRLPASVSAGVFA